MTQNMLPVYPLSELEHLKVHGRTNGCLSPLALFWTGSGIEVNITGSELWVEVEVDYDLYEPWVSVIINSVPVSRQMLQRGRYWLCIFRGMSEDTVKNIRLVKDVQPMSADPRCCLQILAIKTDGQCFPVEEKPYKIEFIGDSITSGEGAIGAKQEEDWIPMWFSGIHNYCRLTAEALHADYRIISQSGWGVLSSWDNNRSANIPDYYEYVCGVITGDQNKKLGALDTHDFSSWQPDVIVVNLGTNDAGAFHSPAWIDAATGKSYKQRLNEDGSYNEEDLKEFEKVLVNFLVKLRKYNKQAQIVWAYGMLGIPMMPAIYRALDSYKQKTGDRRVSVFQLPNTTEETVGARSHPGLQDHQKAAKELAEYLKGVL